jgi:DNA-binding CsgD family transcriptional regulator
MDNGVLSLRETEILQLIAEERTYNEIGLRLGISPHTVKNHISKLLGKLDAPTRVGAILCGIRLGYIAVPGIKAENGETR